MSQDDIFEFSPDPQDSTPIYLQLARKLGQSVREGRFKPDEALPSERSLSEGLQLSRATARNAIDQLVEQGLVIRKRGSGNYIAPRLEQPLVHLTSFSEELKRRGYAPSSRWLGREIVTAKIEEQLSLGLSTNAKVARLERLRLADDVVMAYEVSVLPESVLPEPHLVEGSLYECLAVSNQIPVRGLQHIRALNASTLLATRLGIPENQAVLFITRIGYQASGRAVELTHSYCRSDYYDFVVEMRREE